MNFKVFLACFIGLLAINASHQSPTVKDDNLIPIVVGVLNEVLKASTNLLNQANALVDAVDMGQDEIKDIIVANAVTVAKQINQLILLGVEELRDGATDDGKAVIDCIDAEQGKVEDGITKVLGNIATCAAVEAPVVIAEVRVILGQLGDLRDDVQGQTDTLSTCTDGDLICLVGFAQTIAGTAQKIPDIVVSDITDIINLIQTIAGVFNGCAVEARTEIMADVQDIFNEAVVCIKN